MYEAEQPEASAYQGLSIARNLPATVLHIACELYGQSPSAMVSITTKLLSSCRRTRQRQGVGHEYSTRPARREDAALLAWAILMAGRAHLDRGAWDIVIPKPEEKCLEVLRNLTLLAPRNMCSYAEFLVAEVNGVPAAALSGYDPATNGEHTVGKPLMQAATQAGVSKEEMAEGRAALAKFNTCHIDDLPGAWMVNNVATLPRFRGSGVTLRLLSDILDEGRKQGFRLAQINFFIDNVAAERAYLKAGFQFNTEKRHPDFETLVGCPGLRSFLRTI